MLISVFIRSNHHIGTTKWFFLLKSDCGAFIWGHFLGLALCAHSLKNITGFAVVVVVVLHMPASSPRTSGEAVNNDASCQGSCVGPWRGAFGTELKAGAVLLLLFAAVKRGGPFS